ncbi:MAG: preprotein translocase subunit SecE [Planctomycetaceae bacterium]|nr:preprotein translocase subunit SecE [Planctomycetota bacterium]NUN51266.1 preprotein translocase subunit SecE [Planctomycetaceae bacterium]
MAEGTQPAGFVAGLKRPYRPGQGGLTRRIAYWTGVLFALWAARDLWVWLQGFAALREAILPGTALARLPLDGPVLGWSLLIAAAAAGAAWVFVAWFLKRPWLADLLIDTETEMKKVSWPARDEAWNATKVVSVTVLIFTAVLMVFDQVIVRLLELLTGLPL